MPTDSTLLTIIKITAVFVVISFIVFWVGLVWWVAQDVLTRTRDKIIVAAAVAMTAILGPVGVVIYLVVRPRQTIKERMGEALEQEMLMQAGAISVCPTCHSLAQDDFLACPHCGTILRKACDHCGKLLAMDWDHCPFCGQAQTVVEAPATVVEQTSQIYTADGQKVAEVAVVVDNQPVVKAVEVSQTTVKKSAGKTDAVFDMLRGLFMPVNTKALDSTATTKTSTSTKTTKSKAQSTRAKSTSAAKSATKPTKPASTKAHPTRKKAGSRGKKS